MLIKETLYKKKKNIQNTVAKRRIENEKKFKWGTWYKWLPDKLYLKKQYKVILGEKLNLRNPQTFNEKMQWLKLYDRKPIYTTMADKYAVKEYVASIIGKEYIIPTLGVWNSYDEIDFDKLPERFVLKCTHDSGSIKICKDKSSIDHIEYKKYFDEKLSDNYYLKFREWPYKNVNPRILAEEYISFSNDCCLVDYKFFCFNNIPNFLYISYGLEDHSSARVSFYDLNGKEMPFHRNDYAPFIGAKLPQNFKKMENIAKLLAEKSNSDFIRIDLYSDGKEIFFSEFTFFPCAGFMPITPQKWERKLGDMLQLH